MSSRPSNSPASSVSSLNYDPASAPWPNTPFVSHPNAPRMRPINLPLSPPRPVRVVPLGSSSSTSQNGPGEQRPVLSASGLYIHTLTADLPYTPATPGQNALGLITPPHSPDVAPRLLIHPLLRRSSGYTLTRYDILYPPILSGPHSIQLSPAQGYSPHDFNQPATSPPASFFRLKCHVYTCTPLLPHSIPFPWTVSVEGRAQAVTVHEVLVMIHVSLSTTVAESEYLRFQAPHQYAARSACARRQQAQAQRPGPPLTPGGYGGLVRSDFLSGCTLFAGISNNPDGSLVLMLSDALR